MQKYSKCQKDFFKFEIVKAPLATFDTIDLGSDDESSIHHTTYCDDRSYRSCSQSSEASVQSSVKVDHCQKHIDAGNTSFSESDSGTSTPTNEPEEIEHVTATAKVSRIRIVNNKPPTGQSIVERTRPTVVKDPAIVLKLDANISDKFKKKRKDSSSSSDSDVFTFENIQTRHEKTTPNNVNGKDIKDKSADSVTLSPILIDPSQIKSPSKRKAYEKRLQRLQVTTSPIARPRSTTPINVVTLEEYILSSPEFSPTTGESKGVEKLKIVLPADEFTPKLKSPRRSRKDSEDICTEELLFSHTRSALLVDHAGQIPSSPKRVLIPPTISPATSPKISTTSNLYIENPGSPKYVYFRSQKHCISPLASEPEENWATFPDAPNTQTDSSLNNGTQDSLKYCNDEDVLTINIASESGKCDIELTLSSSNSSNSMNINPSPECSSLVTSTNPLGQDKTESELDFPMDTSEEESMINCPTPESDQY
ncbi:uncharacterized protein LOC126822029 isoform X2 [Patella vulgata]|uniref:uncharacterized protein LOC126822029 isoform X2 n=1 Tax=Patella vulgata TaxID=6465 RepID=UPI0024A813F6|nr:uncharacterized protein LOC126822029 isoform X2 [Patella vulgata]